MLDFLLMGCDYCTQHSGMGFEKLRKINNCKIKFSLEMDKSSIYLGSASKQNALFRKFDLKSALMPPMPRIGPSLIFCGF